LRLNEADEGCLDSTVSEETKNSIIAGGIAPDAEFCLSALESRLGDLASTHQLSRGIESNLATLMSKSTLNYSARNACMGLILLARLPAATLRRGSSLQLRNTVVMAAGSAIEACWRTGTIQAGFLHRTGLPRKS